MAVHAKPLQSYRVWLEDSISPVERGWCPEVVKARYQQALEEFVERTTDDEASRRYAKSCPLPGVDHSLYRLREITISKSITLLAGVHFRSLSTKFPFVGVFAQSRWLAASELVEAHGTLMKEFSMFAPQASWWWSRPGRDIVALPASRPDQHLVMGSLDEIARNAASPLPLGLLLRRIDSTEEVVATFESLYDDFHAARPELKESVPPASQDAIADCARASGLFGCFTKSGVVGLVAAKPDTVHGVATWLMWDIVLARQYCGRGLAPIIQRAVLDRLDRARSPLIAGTIDARNLPSLHTALRVGRQIVGTWTFLSA